METTDEVTFDGSIESAVALLVQTEETEQEEAHEDSEAEEPTRDSSDEEQEQQEPENVNDNDYEIPEEEQPLVSTV